tara:strand:- start:1078 stop:1470 length:393 start_codon:yes stop_codon:yes gene_type:complete
MKISKEKLKQIIQEELEEIEEADMRGVTDYNNTGVPPSQDTNRGRTAREAESENRLAFRILDDISLLFRNANPDSADAGRILMHGLKGIYNKHMSRLRDEDPEVVSIRQPNYPTRSEKPDFAEGLKKKKK